MTPTDVAEDPDGRIHAGSQFVRAAYRHRDQFFILAVLIAIWQALSVYLGSYWVGSPLLVASELLAGIQSGDIIRQASYTLTEAMLGFVIGGFPGAVLPFLLRRWPITTAIIDPFMVGGYGSPKLALAPLFLLWFGIGIEAKIALVAFTSFFIVYFSTLSGVRALDPRLVQMAQVMGASEPVIARKIVFPTAMPYIFTGFRIAIPYAIGGAVVIELLSSNQGLGYLIQFNAMNFNTPGVFAAIIAVCIVVAIINLTMKAVERKLLYWNPSTDRSVLKD